MRTQQRSVRIAFAAFLFHRMQTENVVHNLCYTDSQLFKPEMNQINAKKN